MKIHYCLYLIQYCVHMMQPIKVICVHKAETDIQITSYNLVVTRFERHQGNKVSAWEKRTVKARSVTK